MCVRACVCTLSVRLAVCVCTLSVRLAVCVCTLSVRLAVCVCTLSVRLAVCVCTLSGLVYVVAIGRLDQIGMSRGVYCLYHCSIPSIGIIIHM